jgi:hypothetical protein
MTGTAHHPKTDGPIGVAFAINKARGLTLEPVGMYLRREGLTLPDTDDRAVFTVHEHCLMKKCDLGFRSDPTCLVGAELYMYGPIHLRNVTEYLLI